MQTVLVIVFIATAVFYLAWQMFKRFFTKESTCEGCAISKTVSDQ